LKLLGPVHDESNDNDGHFARIDTPRFSVALYEKNGRVSAVWYNDPAGRRTKAGRGRKIGLYLKRYAIEGTWEQTLDNGYSLWWYNETDDRVLVYGLHEDVVRINDRRTLNG
jgi:hypothetical protein